MVTAAAAASVGNGDGVHRVSGISRLVNPVLGRPGLVDPLPAAAAGADGPARRPEFDGSRFAVVLAQWCSRPVGAGVLSGRRIVNRTPTRRPLVAGLGSEDLSRVEQVQRIERVLDGPLHDQRRGVEFALQAGHLQQADAVFGGHRAAESDGGVEHLLEGELRALAGVVIADRRQHQRMQVAVTGVRDRSRW